MKLGNVLFPINPFLNNDIEMHICCFCENGDLLSQLRGYGSKEQKRVINGVLDIFFSSKLLSSRLYFFSDSYLIGKKI